VVECVGRGLAVKRTTLREETTCLRCDVVYVLPNILDPKSGSQLVPERTRLPDLTRQNSLGFRLGLGLWPGLSWPWGRVDSKPIQRLY